VRYIDDFVICFQYRSDAIRVQDALVGRVFSAARQKAWIFCAFAGDLGGCSRRDELAEVQHHEALTQRHDRTHVVLDDDQRQAFLAQLAQQRKDSDKINLVQSVALSQDGKFLAASLG
jgi:hypothetical protein